MVYPCLIPKQFCKTPIQVTIYQEGLSEEGAPLEALKWEGFCNYQDNAKTVLTADKKLIQLSGSAFIPNDIAPNLSTLSGGFVVVNGIERKIFQGTKARNPDGTVNFTRIDIE